MSDTLPRRLRFSLLTLLLVTTIVAMGVTIFLQWRALEPMRRELKQLREENGNLWIEDPSKIHAIRGATDREFYYRFRVYVPQGRSYFTRYGSLDIPLEGTPKLGNRHLLHPGENIITVRHQQSWDKDCDEPLPSIRFWGRVNDRGWSEMIFEHKNDWLVHQETNRSSYGVKSVGFSTEVFPEDESVILFSMRAQKVEQLVRDANGSPLSWSARDIAEPCDGYMLWIEPSESPPVEKMYLQR